VWDGAWTWWNARPTSLNPARTLVAVCSSLADDTTSGGGTYFLKNQVDCITNFYENSKHVFAIDFIRNSYLMGKPSLARGTNKDVPLCMSYSTNKMFKRRLVSVTVCDLQ